MGEEPGLVPVEVVGVRQHMSADEIVVLLLDADAELLVPILVGPAEATAIAAAQAGIVPPRPMTHDLLRDVIRASGDDLDHVEITRLADGVFYAELVLRRAARVDARASDAIALALRFDAPVLCSAEVVALAGVEVRTTTSEEDLERFREFLDQVEPEDFETGAEPEEDR
ncbi:bifunctional nuclease family protein [Cellulomonas sp. HZM]|uniref:bifunctional nuclease family protein n=1 Tax=Cellulomonas sp. HZM TaxID=1454010 RepID=UPI0004935ECF|nr:bifunctional nuclease family protein [Cellulomonas sp. HZM]